MSESLRMSSGVEYLATSETDDDDRSVRGVFALPLPLSVAVAADAVAIAAGAVLAGVDVEALGTRVAVFAAGAG